MKVIAAKKLPNTLQGSKLFVLNLLSVFKSEIIYEFFIIFLGKKSENQNSKSRPFL